MTIAARMTWSRDFEGRVIVVPAEPLSMPLSLRVPPIDGLVVTELAPESGWEHFEFPDTVPAGLVA